MCIFKLISFLKVNQHAQHSNGSFWFVLFFNVNLQTYFVFESKLTFTTFKWLFKVRALFRCVSSNLFHFESKSRFTTFKWLFKVHALLQCVSSNTLFFFKVNQHAQMAIQGSCSFTMCIFKYISFLKVNQHSQHSKDIVRF